MKTTLESLAVAPASLQAPKTAADAERMQVLTLVEQFEGMLLSEMLRDVRAGDEEEDGFGLGASTMTDTMQGEFGLALSRAGGLGLGDMLAKALLRRSQTDAAVEAALVPTASAGPALSAPGVPTTRGAADDHAAHADPTGGGAAAVVADGVPVSSAFGWRSDPFTGRATFHKGVDLAAAYGTEVRAFDGGVVKSAGERSGYGLTVVVDHGDGRETLYAHLSSMAVAPGDPVAAGQPIARSGNSGRATGAHLHFEAREYGRPVDAGRLAAVWNGRASDTSVGGSDE
ncbi:MAG: peptidoglycan DD-metalloendopeptidase family protein [Acidobacteria bacterium]|nr:peptidoglycan DD-metalloendopeptidase family protein [Acidobacteriota bacterium]